MFPVWKLTYRPVLLPYGRMNRPRSGRTKGEKMRKKTISLIVAAVLGGAVPALAQQVVVIQQTTIQQTTIVAIDASTARTATAARPARRDMPKIYAVRNTANYCPSGLQPITINGVICCGTPNQSVSYQSMKAHPVARVQSRARKNSRIVCPVGEKGCYSE